MRAKILGLDIETAPNLGWAYGKWQTNIIRVEEYSQIISFSCRWYGSKKKIHRSLKDTGTEEELVKELHKFLDEADAMIAHNAYGFDNKVIKASFARYRILPPSPYKVIDTLRIARSQFKFPGGNSLNEVAAYLGLGQKEAINFSHLWYDCLQGSKKAWKLLRIYNDKDVDLVLDLYDVMLPYITNHPNLATLFQERGKCPKCLSDKLQSRGQNMRASGPVQRYQCMSCGGWCTEATVKQNGRINNLT